MSDVVDSEALENHNVTMPQGSLSADQIKRCKPRARGAHGRSTSYEKGSVLDAEENREVEFKSLVNCQPRQLLPWKLMGRAKKFICACLNAAISGVIYFGVENGGEIVGLDVENDKDDIQKAFQQVLDNHIITDLTGRMLKGGEQNCISIYFVPVTKQGTHSNGLYVIEIEVKREWRYCEDKIYYSKRWNKKDLDVENSSHMKKLTDFFTFHNEIMEDVAIRTNGKSDTVKPYKVRKDVLQHLQSKYKEWCRENQEENGAASETTINITGQTAIVGDHNTANIGVLPKDASQECQADALPPSGEPRDQSENCTASRPRAATYNISGGTTVIGNHNTVNQY